MGILEPQALSVEQYRALAPRVRSRRGARVTDKRGAFLTAAWQAHALGTIDAEEYRLLASARAHRFIAGRKYEFDWCWPERLAAIEVDGAVHRIRGRFDRDREKFNHATLRGWAVLHFTPKELKDNPGARCREVLELLGMRGAAGAWR